MIRVEQQGAVFTYRVGAVAFRDDRVLLCRSDDEYWYAPGGRVEMGETSATALRRELREELDTAVTIDRLLLVAENFFTYEGVPVHELSLYYLVDLPGDAPVMTCDREFRGMEDGSPLLFYWHSLDALSEIRLVPDFLPRSISSLPETPQHIVHHDGVTA